MSKLSIVIPVYYNEENLEDLYADLMEKAIPMLPDYEIVMVDDGSEDASWRIMNEIRMRDPGHVKCVKLSRNFGEHAALLAGFNVCTGDCAVTKQADLQEDSTLIPEMYESWKKGNDVVLAVRRSRVDSAGEKAAAGAYYKIINKLVTKNMPVEGTDCYLLDRKVIEVIKKFDETNSSLTLQVLWAGFKTDTVYFDRREREKGKGRWTLAKKLKLAADSVLSFSYLPIRFMTWIGVIFDFIALILIIDILIEYFTVGVPVRGWAMLTCIVLMTAGVIMFMLGILGEYVWRTLDATRNRPPFIIDEIKTDTDGMDKT
ncbi:MAG: glycosyltransferase family 2 protein, partial [Lachnospiraceae bacterium]|nr:glycosyltransferase family 2 protein [Lachnospiraceae bacterium]